MSRGKFIVFEGGEGSGKTQHVQFTQEYLLSKGYAVHTGHEPGGTEFGLHLREVLLKKHTFTTNPKAELFLFLSDRAQHVAEIIRPTLEKGDTMICDRFSGSTFAYQIGARHLDNPDLIMQMDAYSRDGIEPDLVIYLDVDPETGIKRKSAQPGHIMTSFDKEDLEFHTNVRAFFQKMASDNDIWKQIDANQSLEEVQAKIKTLIDTLFAS
jgi:dTMP kinase